MGELVIAYCPLDPRLSLDMSKLHAARHRSKYEIKITDVITSYIHTSLKVGALYFYLVNSYVLTLH